MTKPSNPKPPAGLEVSQGGPPFADPLNAAFDPLRRDAAHHLEHNRAIARIPVGAGRPSSSKTPAFPPGREQAVRGFETPVER